MSKIIIFSGTTEGRRISELLCAEHIYHTVCVAGDYGKKVMTENEYADVRTGRMDADDMRSFFRSFGTPDDILIIDATHPYAKEVTSNIRKVAAELHIEYVRVKRDSGVNESRDANIFADITECAKAVNEALGNILLTTGVKELEEYCNAVSEDTKKRTYVRVLPFVDSLKECEKNNIEPSHIIAMQGPFSTQINAALIAQYDIKHLITKDGGDTGGFYEKAAACEKTGARLYVISRPDDEGISAEEAFEKIIKKPVIKDNEPLTVYLIGGGMGTKKSLSLEAAEAIEDCDAVFGSKRLLLSISCRKKYEMYLAKDIIPVLEKDKKIKKAAVIFSGDTGFYSGAKKMTEALNSWRGDIKVKLLPGISSVSYLSARLKESYDDAVLYSIHGKNTDRDIKNLIDIINCEKKAFALLSEAKDVSCIAKKMLEDKISGKIYVGISLGTEAENIRELSLEEAVLFDDDGIGTALICNDHPMKRRVMNVRRDSEFIRSEIPMTKECIRHESIARLGLMEGDIFFDIGGGTGSVAIEAASLHNSIEVYTIEKNKAAAELIKKNISNFGLENITVKEGCACDVLGELPKPDCVFIGGSGGELSKIMDILHSKGEGIRFVVNAITLETLEKIRRLIKKYEARDEETVLISVSDVKKVGDHNMLRGNNPVWIISFTL